MVYSLQLVIKFTGCLQDRDGGMERANGPLYSPIAPFTLPEYKTARVSRAVLYHRNKKAIIIAFLFRALFTAGFGVFLFISPQNLCTSVFSLLLLIYLFIIIFIIIIIFSFKS